MRRRASSIVSVLLFCLSLYFVMHSSNIVFADDETKFHEQYGESEEEVFEEVGEMLGWGAIMIASFSGILFPFRRQASHLSKMFPKGKSLVTFTLRMLGKWHVRAGIVAFLLMLSHGGLMYISEEELGIREYVGGIATMLIAMATLVGFILLKQRRNNVVRVAHISLLSIAGILTAVHILLS
ncbi:hypothetical protein [Anoxybacillus eryuanensis]|uniref:hypothetical protein n=1 Tax=Anoxybacillus eryuanensis TaxID=651866 RepID=UPI003EF50D46